MTRGRREWWRWLALAADAFGGVGVSYVIATLDDDRVDQPRAAVRSILEEQSPEETRRVA